MYSGWKDKMSKAEPWKRPDAVFYQDYGPWQRKAYATLVPGLKKFENLSIRLFVSNGDGIIRWVAWSLININTGILIA